VALSADGRVMAFGAFGDRSALQIADVDTGAITSIALDGDAYDPAFAPDGRRVALVTAARTCDQADCSNTVEPTTLWVVDTADQSTFTAFSQPGTGEQIPTWSPVDPNMMAIATALDSHDGPLMLVAADGTSSTTLDIPATGEMPSGLAWSPDGRAVAYEHLDGEADNHFTLSVWMSPADGSAAHEVFAAPCCDPEFGRIAFSPDGTAIALALVYLDGSNPSGIYIAPLDGGPIRLLTEMTSAAVGTGDNIAWLNAP
jgi:Tol biopolymer transport system component